MIEGSAASARAISARRRSPPDSAIAGVSNERGNVVGLMPHPEHATEPGFGPDTPAAMASGTDGLTFFTSVIESTLVK